MHRRAPCSTSPTRYRAQRDRRSNRFTRLREPHGLFPAARHLLLFHARQQVATYALKLDRANLASSTLDVVTTQGPTSPHQEPAYDYDSTNHVIGGGVIDSTFYVFDPTNSTWSSQPISGGTPRTLAFHALRYDPVDNVFIFVTDYESGQHTWAYRYKNPPR